MLDKSTWESQKSQKYAEKNAHKIFFEMKSLWNILDLDVSQLDNRFNSFLLLSYILSTGEKIKSFMWEKKKVVGLLEDEDCWRNEKKFFVRSATLYISCIEFELNNGKKCIFITLTSP